MPMPPHSWQAVQGNFKHSHYVHESQHKQHTHNTCTQQTQHMHTTHTHKRTHTNKYIALQKKVISNQHGSSAYQPFHLVSTVNRFIMSHACIPSYIFILHQCLLLNTACSRMYQLVSIMYTVLYSVCGNADLLAHDHVA